MGVDHVQHCVFGICLRAADLRVELSPEISEKQPRYDTKTGAITHYEKVVVKHAESMYRFEDLEEGCFFELADAIGRKYENLESLCDGNKEDKHIYIGYSLGDNAGDWGSDLLSGEVSLHGLVNMENSLRNIFPKFEEDIKIYFFNWVG